jgi:hypothetical protein
MKEVVTMAARHFHLVTTQDLFRSRYEVLKPLIAFMQSDQPYAFDNTRELISVFTDLINTEVGEKIVQDWSYIFASVLGDLERLEPIIDYADEHTVSLAYHAACAAIDALTIKLTHVLISS